MLSNKTDYIQYSKNNYHLLENIHNQYPETILFACENVKTEGNRQYSLNQFENAINYYLLGICFYRYYSPQTDKVITEKKINIKNENLKIQTTEMIKVLFLNLAACYLKTAEYVNAINACMEVLNLDEDNPKALYRISKALLGRNDADLNDIKQAIVFLEKAERLAPNDSNIQNILEKANDSYIHKQIILNKIESPELRDIYQFIKNDIHENFDIIEKF